MTEENGGVKKLTNDLLHAGYIILRNKKFAKLVQEFRVSGASMEQLKDKTREFLPEDFACKVVTGENGEIYLFGDRWEAMVEEYAEQDERPRFIFRFEDKAASIIPSLNTRTSLEMNTVLTAIEKAILTFDARAFVAMHFATGTERTVDLGKRKQGVNGAEMLIKLPLSAAVSAPATIADAVASAASEAATDSTAAAAAGPSKSLVDNAMTRYRNRAYLESGGDQTLLVLRYVGTPAMPPEVLDEAREILLELGYPEEVLETRDVEVEASALNEIMSSTGEKARSLVDRGFSAMGLETDEVVSGGRKVASHLGSRALDLARRGATAAKSGLSAAVTAMNELGESSDDGPAAASSQPARFCPQCGAKAAENARFCTSCGSPLE